MEHQSTYPLDKAGRIAIPQDIRDTLNWQPGERMTIRVDSVQFRSICIEPERIRCALCDAFTESLQTIKKAHVCADCFEELAGHDK